MHRRIAGLHREERGVAVAQVGLLFAAPLFVASALGAAVIKAGNFSSARLDQAVHSAIRDTSSGIQQQGPAYARSNGTTIRHVAIDIGTTAGGTPVNVDPTASAEPTTVRFISPSRVEQRIPYVTHWITGDDDPLLEPGEIAEVEVDVSKLTQPGEPFTLEIRPAHGLYATVYVTPAAASHLDAVIPLP